MGVGSWSIMVSVSLCLCLHLCLHLLFYFFLYIHLCLSVSVSLFVPLSPSLSLVFFLCRLCVSVSFPPSLNLSFVSPHSLGPAVPPRFVNKVRAVPFVDGEDAQITCTIEGAPYPQIRWATSWLGGGAAEGTRACPGAVLPA